MDKRIVLLASASLLALTLTGCITDPAQPPPPAAPHVDYSMAVAGQSWSVVLDGSSIGQLTYAGQTLGRDVSAGGHSFYVRDAAHGGTSQSFPFSISNGQKLTYTLGTGNTAINWNYDQALSVSNIRISLLNNNTVVRMSADFNATGYSQRTFEIGGYWLSYSNGSYIYVSPPSGYTFNTPGGYVGHVFYTTPSSNSPYTCTPYFDVSASAFPVRTAGTHYYGMFKVYSGTSVNSVNAAAISQAGPASTIWVSFSLSPSGGAGEAVVRQADGSTTTQPVAVDVREP